MKLTDKHSHKPKPDDRSDNVEKLQDMVQDTIQNIEKSHETMRFTDGEEKQAIETKNKRREEAIDAMRNEIKDEYNALD
ncbi:small acid-soluble spore protein Tlp [Oceanobacillus sp. M65]|uniref:Small, acid-soluble spore protein Tlp n=1 Tax=Oceanobacillus jordanicus TaxID=2867266 RepID=A0AAW5B3I0_9BACI|nr:small acid-soluble spore protein Tlp [Oceanobacillus iheyensis]MCG3418936.1 small acid-soluble spore protein Tlp [Oceanobacillus jordanicus]